MLSIIIIVLGWMVLIRLLVAYGINTAKYIQRSVRREHERNDRKATRYKFVDITKKGTR